MLKPESKYGLYHWPSEIKETMAEAKVAKRFNWRRFLIFGAIGAVLVLLISGVVSLTGLWNTILLEPMLNFLILMSKYFLGSFGIAIIVLTILIRLVMLPLTMKQLQSSKAMMEIGPKMKELQKKYAKDQQKLNQEMMKLYKEEGINPLGCAGPMLIQFPIWIALYQSVIQALASTPENLLGLSKQLYGSAIIRGALPLNHHFLWLDLTSGDIFMAILTVVSMWLLQKMSTMPSTDPQQQSMNRIMLWAMPLMFGLFSLTLPSGLSLYWIVSNIVSIIFQYRVTGWGTLTMPALPSFLKRGAPQSVDNPAAKTGGTAGTGKKAGKGLAPEQSDAKEDGASPEKAKAVGSDIISQRKKVIRYGRRRSKRKD
jgi:YidC/Oxa1 family membrane protein insertase